MKLEEFTQIILDSSNIKFLLNGLSLDIIKETEKHGGLYRAIIFNSVPVGVVMIDPENECSVAVHPDYRERGIATKALKKLVKLAFEEFNVENITTRTEINKPSSKLVSKFGLKETSRTDSEIFSVMTKEMWFAFKG